MAKSLPHPINHDFRTKSAGGVPDQRTMTHQGKASTKPGKASAKSSMIQGPFGGKKPQG